MKSEIKISIPAFLENLSVIRAIIRTYLETQKIEAKDIFKIISIVDELTTNVVEHGYRYSKGDIIIKIKKENDIISLIVEDDGVGFDEKKHSKDEGGMGLLLVKNIADSFQIEKKINGTRIKVTKQVKEVLK